jgi:glycosyltransferase involved in cell wall biosynthesis
MSDWIELDFDDVDVCLITYNEELFIEKTLATILPFFPHFCILDMESSDRTVEIIRDVLGSRASVVLQPRSELFTKGFAFARNKVSEFSELPWKFHVDADEALIAEDGFKLLLEPNAMSGVAAKITRRNLTGETSADFRPSTLARYSAYSVEQHVRIYRKAPEVRWESFIHEELWMGGVRAVECTGMSNVTLNHVSSFRPSNQKIEKEELYAWILMRIRSHKELQKNMREFYYTEHIDRNYHDLSELALRFAERNNLGKDWGDLL